MVKCRIESVSFIGLYLDCVTNGVITLRGSRFHIPAGRLHLTIEFGYEAAVITEGEW